MKSRAMKWMILGLALLSVAAMVAGWFAPTVPYSWFVYGSWLFAISIALFSMSRTGILRTLFALFVLLIVILVVAPICMPIPEIEKDYPRRHDELVERGDSIKDKNPPYVPEMIERRRVSEYRECRVDKSTSVIALNLGETTPKEHGPSNRLYPTFGRAMEAAKQFDCEMLPSVDLVDSYTKHLDDRVLAALEEHINTGSSIFPGGKQRLLASLLDEVVKRGGAHADEAAAYLTAAIELGGGRSRVPKAIERGARSQIHAFLGDAAKSTPSGFYTQTNSLRRIFMRDRFLAQPVRRVDAVARFVPIASALAARQDLLRAYEAFRDLNERCCNAKVDLDICDLLRYRGLFDRQGALCDAHRRLSGQPAC